MLYATKNYLDYPSSTNEDFFNICRSNQTSSSILILEICFTQKKEKKICDKSIHSFANDKIIEIPLKLNSTIFNPSYCLAFEIIP
jgi:hypothetical protein